MPRQPLFAGLVVDEYDRPAGAALVGDEPCYVVDDAGFRYHIPSQKVDRQVLEQMRALIKGNEDVISAQTAKMLGQDDIFSRAMLENQLKNIEQQFEALFEVGIPEEARAFMGMSGFKVVINYHGDVLEVRQAGIASDEGGGDHE
jgi:hypothetical protein